MTRFELFTSILAIITIFGAILNCRMCKWGFPIWGVCNFIWIWVDLSRGIWPQSVVYAVFLGLNVYGWINWTKKQGNSEKL